MPRVLGSKEQVFMANGTKAFFLATFMAIVAISASQGQARHVSLDTIPTKASIH